MDPDRKKPEAGSAPFPSPPVGERVRGRGIPAPLCTLTPAPSLEGRGSSVGAAPVALAAASYLPIRVERPSSLQRERGVNLVVVDA